MAPRRLLAVAAALLTLRCCGAGSGKGPLLLELELHEPECRLVSESNRKLINLRPLDLNGIQPLTAVRPHAEFIARGALSLESPDQEGPFDLLLDSRTSDLWLPTEPSGVGGAPLELLEHASGGSCGAAPTDEEWSGMPRAPGTAGIVNLAGSVSDGNVKILTSPSAEVLTAQGFVALARDARVPQQELARKWDGVLGLARKGASRAGRPLWERLSEAAGGSVMALAQSGGTSGSDAALLLGTGSDVDRLCETGVVWANLEKTIGGVEGEWTFDMGISTGAFLWRGAAALDLTGAMLRVPTDMLAQVLGALLSDQGAGECVQPHQPRESSSNSPTEVATGIILCPCASAAARPPLRLAVGGVLLPVPWESLLQPVQDEDGLCLLRVHAAAPGEPPSVGAALLGAAHVVALDYEQEKVGLCTARDGALTAMEAELQRGTGQWPGRSAASRSVQAVEQATEPTVATTTTVADTTMEAADEPKETSWLGSLGHPMIAFLVILITSGPAVGFSVYKNMQQREGEGWRPWRMSGADSGDDSDEMD